jgi:hypothetical protein
VKQLLSRRSPLVRVAAWPWRLAGRLHRDEQGTISMLTVFAVMLLAMLLGMVMNAGRAVDGKIRLQNAADAVACSGAGALARGMNTLAFTNHLLCEVFAMNAWLEEAQEQNAKRFVPRILSAWRQVGTVLAASSNSGLRRVGLAILEKVPLEQNVVDAFSAWAEAVSMQMLPVMRGILDQELIPQYQRAVLKYWPDVAQATAAEMAARHSVPELGRGAIRAELLWADMTPLLGGDTPFRTLPVADPQANTAVANEAREQRALFARWYLEQWNNDTLRFFRSGASREYGGSARLSMLYPLWRVITCGRLDDVLGRYYSNNLPMVIEENLRPRATTLPATPAIETATPINRNIELEKNYVVLGVVRWNALPQMLPKLFANPVPDDPLAFAEAHYFVPQRRLMWRKVTTGGDEASSGSGPGIPGFGGVPGEILDPPDVNTPSPGPGGGSGGDAGGEAGGTAEVEWVVVEEGADGLPADATWLPFFEQHRAVANNDSWTLFNQNWTARLTPAWQARLTELRAVGALSSAQLRTISVH